MGTRITTQFLDAITEKVVLPVIYDQYEQKANTFNVFMKGKGEKVNSRGCGIPGDFVPSASNGWSEEGGDLPIPAADEQAQMLVRYARYRRGLELTWDALKDLEEGKTLMKGVMARVSKHTLSAIKELNRQMYGSGDGTVAIPLSVSSTTVTFAASRTSGYTHGSRKILKNGRYQFIDSTGAILSGGMSGTVCVCSSISRSGNTATFNQVPSDLTSAIATGTCRLVYQGSYNLAIRGFLYHFSNGNESYQTLLRSDYNDLRATVVDAGGSEITVALFLLLDKELTFRVDAEDVGEALYFCNPTQSYMYEQLGHSAKRFTASDKTMDLGYERVAYNGKMFNEDVDCDYDKIYKAYKNVFKKFENRPLGPMREGSGFWRDVPSFAPGSEDTGTHKERVRGYIGWDGELGCTQPGALGVIKNLEYQQMGFGY
jgi:hypothetical protein